MVLIPESEEPIYLSDEATKSASDSLAAKLGTASVSNVPKKRGRPKGSRIDPATGRLIRPDGSVAPKSTGAKKPADPRKTLEAKRKRIDEYSEKIVSDFNDVILEGLIALGVPSAALYQPGMEPKNVPKSSPYTPIGQRVAISSFQAHIWAAFAVEMEGTAIGEKLTAVGEGDSNVRALVLGIASVLAAGQYIKGLLDLKREMQPLLDAIKAQREGTINE